ncbi:MAG: N-acetyl-gamma-glutamyl-phosphate reductase [Verrucomicrobiia bacterium]
MDTVRTAIVGASGYSGEELVNLLLHHPHAELSAVTSRQYAGKTLAEIFPKYAAHPRARALKFEEPDVWNLAQKAEIIFLALPHGVAAEYAAGLLEKEKRVIDLSADFRLNDADVYREFYGHEHPAPDLLARAVYGLPEIYGKTIKGAELIANPGCYPTSILLPTIPLLKAGLIKATGIIADSMSAVSGAGRKTEVPYLFVECNESVRPYGVPKHRHLSEIEQEMTIAAGREVTIQFTPHLVPINRGILSTLYLAPEKFFESESEMNQLNERIAKVFEEAYADEPFVRVLTDGSLPDTKNVAGTNYIDIAWRLDIRTGRLIVMSAEDNIMKGASGQAVQNFNIMCGYDQTAGLV